MRFTGLAMALMTLACSAPQKARIEKPDTEGAQFSLLHFTDGSEYHFAQDRGQVVLIDVWATWCEPCRDLLPIYNQLGAQFASQGLRVYGLTVDEDAAFVKRFLDEHQVSFPILVDTRGDVTEQFLNVRLIPTTALFDRKGRLRFRHDGVEPDLEVKILKEIQMLINESEARQ